MDMDLDRVSEEFLKSKALRDMADGQAKHWREVLVEALNRSGELDDRGNRWLPASRHMVKHERRTSTSFDSAKAERWLRGHDLWEEGSEEIPARRVVNEDKFLGAIYGKDAIPEDFYSTKETWAVKVTEEDQYDY